MEKRKICHCVNEQNHPTHPREPRRAETPGKGQRYDSQITWNLRRNPRPSNYQVSFSFSLSFFSIPLFFSPQVFPLYLTLARLCRLPLLLYRMCMHVAPPSHITQVEVCLLYPPIRWDLLWLVALHVLLHGGEAGAVLRADGALVGRGAIVCSQVLDHG